MTDWLQAFAMGNRLAYRFARWAAALLVAWLVAVALWSLL